MMNWGVKLLSLILFFPFYTPTPPLPLSTQSHSLFFLVPYYKCRFRHVTWLRRRMATARIGSSNLFDSDVLGFLRKQLQGSALQGRPPIVVGSEGGIGGDWENIVHIIR